MSEDAVILGLWHWQPRRTSYLANISHLDQEEYIEERWRKEIEMGLKGSRAKVGLKGSTGRTTGSKSRTGRHGKGERVVGSRGG